MLKSVTLPHLRRPCSKISVMCGERQRRTALEAFSSSDGSGTLVCSEYTRGGEGNKKITITRLMSHSSRHTPHVTPLMSHPSRHTPHITPLMSHPSHPTPHVTPLTSHPSRHTPHITPLTTHCTVYSYITPQRSTYPHTSHIPPHFTSHYTHTPPCPPPQTLIFSTLVSLNA